MYQAVREQRPALPPAAGAGRAGPALVDALVQAWAAGALAGGPTELRSLLRHTQDGRLHLPTPAAEAAWRGAGERIGIRA